MAVGSPWLGSARPMRVRRQVEDGVLLDPGGHRTGHPTTASSASYSLATNFSAAASCWANGTSARVNSSVMTVVPFSCGPGGNLIVFVTGTAAMIGWRAPAADYEAPVVGGCERHAFW